MIFDQLRKLNEVKTASRDQWEGVMTTGIAIRLLLLEWDEWYAVDELFPPRLFGSCFGRVVEEATAVNAAEL
uniref:Uncharacterized protein n=1 Tax=Chromera velia CCMP2878 TaxID=1169474 RepID=A0A0G4GZ02_9ALVE|eukprot:Cvel_5422.t1-p1 / transcript=Cvel_5422.t1 / gene=Cvel_5422 / organism=Chromera_velia_CCMP2878 / gene_product=hypothetical protein / transcript_product=hypothetical protein / location=Cvel_scaffold252:63206-63418(-) / protein_length=71 / sequence_SO=supercontig / SO=protein_coding / is_pseudo=false